jgi:hypothetical protein
MFCPAGERLGDSSTPAEACGEEPTLTVEPGRLQFTIAMSFLPTCPCLLPALAVRGEAIMCRAPGKQLRARVLLWTQLISERILGFREGLGLVTSANPLKQLSSRY